MRALILLVSALMLAGCTTSKRHIVAWTGTTLGFDVSQNPVTQLYQAKFGYGRAEVVFVPNAETNVPVTDVVMEVRYHGLLSLAGGGLYQRLAIGSEAVRQPGAVLMFAKDANGTLDPAVAQAALASVKTITNVSAPVTAAKLPLAEAYKAAPDKAAWHTAVKAFGFTSFEDFLVNATSIDTVTAVLSALKAAGLWH